MTEQINSLSWVPMGANNTKRVAFVSLNAATDTEYLVRLQGTATGDPDASNVIPVWLQIDNLANNALIAVTFGGVVFNVQPFSRQNFPIDGTMQNATISIPSGTASLWLSEQRLAEDAENSVAAGQAANAALLAAINANTVAVNASTAAINQMNVDLQNSIAVLTLATNNVLAATNALIAITVPNKPLVLVTGARAMVAGDDDKSLVFNFGAAGAYSLLSAAIAGAGFEIDVSNPGAQNVSVTPVAGQLINNVFTNGSPMIMRTGAKGKLVSDGVNWIFTGTLLFTITDVLLANTIPAGTDVQGPTNHLLGKTPNRFVSTFICVTADGAFGVGARVDPSRVNKYAGAGAGAAGAVSSVSINATVTQVTQSWGWSGVNTAHNIAPDGYSQITGSASVYAITTNRWNLETVCYADW